MAINKRSELGINLCEFCRRSFKKESSLLAHLCEEKRRFQQQDLIHCRLGYQAYSAIYKKISNSNKTLSEFRSSTYYLACVRWGRFVLDVNCFDINNYLNWLIKENKPIDDWNTDSVYEKWLIYYALSEPPWDAIERSIKTMTVWNNEDFNNYFLSAGVNRVTQDIMTDKISPWMLYLSSKGQIFIKNLSFEIIQKIWGWINSTHWNNFIEQYNSECNEIIEFLKENQF